VPTVADLKTVVPLWKKGKEALDRCFPSVSSSPGKLRVGQMHQSNDTASQTDLTGENAQNIVGSAADSVSSAKAHRHWRSSFEKRSKRSI
jgi:hypothetical protein